MIGDPIELLREGVEAVRLATNERPSLILVHQTVYDSVRAHTERSIRRMEKFLRKPILSGRYDKRHRQRLAGVAHRRQEKRRWFLLELPALRANLEAMK